MKKKIRVAFVGFHENYDLSDDPKYKFLAREYNLVIDEENPEYVLCGAFSYDYLKYKNAIRIFYTGEAVVPDYNLVDYSIDFEHMDYLDRHLRAPLGVLTLPERLKANDAILEAGKRKFCSFLYSNSRAHLYRDHFLSRLSAHKGVDSGGSHLNNIGRRVSNKLQFISQYKFNIAFENALHHGYTTEKVFDALAANTIPIYWGNPLIGQDINEDRIVNCHKYDSTDEIIRQIIKIDSDDDLFNEMLAKPWFLEGQEVDYEAKMGEFLKHIIDQPLCGARRRGEGTWNSLHERRIEPVMRHLSQHERAGKLKTSEYVRLRGLAKAKLAGLARVFRNFRLDSTD